MYQLVIFDWDGTLMDSTQKIANCIRASARDVGLVEPTVKEAKNIIGLGLYECMEVLFPTASKASHAAMVERYRYHFVSGDQTEQSLFSGVNEGLTKLEEAGALLAVATGKSRVGLDRAFSVVSLNTRFVVTRCADETRTKPNPQMLHEILDFTAIDVSKAIMVGDTSFDMDMASNAKMAGLGVSYGAHPKEILLESHALSVQDSVDTMIDWLLDGRIEKAYARND